MKVLKTIQILLTILAVVAIIVEIWLVWWMRSMPGWDPVRIEWKSRVHLIGGILSFGVIFPWVVFSIVHFFVRIIREDIRTSV